MKLAPQMDDPRAVLISRTPVSTPVDRDDYRRAAHEILSAMRVELEKLFPWIKEC